MDTQIFALLARRGPSAVEAEPRPAPLRGVDGESRFEGIYSELVERNGEAAEPGTTSTVTTPAAKPGTTSARDATQEEPVEETVTMSVLNGVSPEMDGNSTPAILAAFERIAGAVSVESTDAVASTTSESSDGLLPGVVSTASALSAEPVLGTLPTPTVPTLPVNAEGATTSTAGPVDSTVDAQSVQTSVVASTTASSAETSQTTAAGTDGVVATEPAAGTVEAATEVVAAESASAQKPTAVVGTGAAPTPETVSTAETEKVQPQLPVEETSVGRPDASGPFAQVVRGEEAAGGPSNPFESSKSSGDTGSSVDSQTTDEKSDPEDARRFVSPDAAAAPAEPSPTPSTTVGVATVDRFVDSRQGEDKGNVEPGPMPERTQGAPSPQAAEKPVPVPELDMTRFVDRVVRFVHTMVGRNESSLEMRLNPPELGSVRLSMELKAGELRMSLETSTEATRQIITQNLDGLRQTLVQHGFSVGRLDVSLGQHFADGGTAQSDAQPRHHTHGHANGQPDSDQTSENRPVYVSLTRSRYLDLVA